MVTAAILGAAVGAGLALTITLTLLIYRYYVSQKSEDDLWSSWEREGYRSRSALDPTVRKHSRMNSKAAQADDKPRHKKLHYPVPARSLASRKPLYLPLNNSVSCSFCMNLIKCAYVRAIATVRLETSIVY